MTPIASPVAEYHYDAENRRVKKTVGDEVTTYFLDGIHEVQETDCRGVVLRQYVYGAGVDELIAMDRSPSEDLTVQETCTDTGSPSPVQGAVDCVPTISGTTVTGECGPCTHMTDSLGTDVSCNVCLSDAWRLLGTGEPGPTSGCVQCDGATSWDAMATIGLADAGCSPCGPSLGGHVLVDQGTLVWNASAAADSGCTPCPVPHAGASAAANPANATTEPLDCSHIDLSLRLYFLQDDQQSVYALVNDIGQIREGFEYDPYGNVTVLKPSGTSGVIGAVTFSSWDTVVPADDATSQYQYTGRRYDPESGLMQYRSRYYSGDMGRFISEDTIGVWGDPNSLGNAYAYVSDMPHEEEDPSGESWRALRKAMKVAKKIVGVLSDLIDFLHGPCYESAPAAVKLHITIARFEAGLAIMLIFATMGSATVGLLAFLLIQSIVWTATIVTAQAACER